MDVDLIEAGSKLDALIAEKVLGYKGVEYHERIDSASMGESLTRGVPSYSTDLKAAWEVVERLIADGWRVSLSHNGNQYAAAWDFRIVSKDERKREIAIEDTPAHAICCAALKAQQACAGSGDCS